MKKCYGEKTKKAIEKLGYKGKQKKQFLIVLAFSVSLWNIHLSYFFQRLRSQPLGSMLFCIQNFVETETKTIDPATSDLIRNRIGKALAQNPNLNGRLTILLIICIMYTLIFSLKYNLTLLLYLSKKLNVKLPNYHEV